MLTFLLCDTTNIILERTCKQRSFHFEEYLKFLPRTPISTANVKINVLNNPEMILKYLVELYLNILLPNKKVSYKKFIPQLAYLLQCVSVPPEDRQSFALPIRNLKSL